MAWIDVVTYCRPEDGNVVNVGDLAYVKMEVTNNLPWELKKIIFYLDSLTGPIHLEPANQTLPCKIIGPDSIPPGGTAVQEFVLKADDVGPATANMHLGWVLDNTNLTFDVKGSTAFMIHPS